MAGIPFAGLEAVTALVNRIKGKTDKIASPTNDNLVVMDANGNIKNSGIGKSAVVTYKTFSRAWNSAGNRYIKLSDLYNENGLVTNSYMVVSRNGEAYIMECGKSDGNKKAAPEVRQIYRGTGKLASAGFAWDSSTGEVVLMTQGYNTVIVTQIAGLRADFTMSELLTSNPLETSSAVTMQEFLTPTSGATYFMSSPATFVVNSNETLQQWASHAAGNDYSSVYIASGTYTLASGGINLTAAGTKQVEGHPSSKLVFESLTPVDGNYSAALYYTSRPTDPSYNIKNVNVECTGAPATSANNYPCAFRNCVNLTNCSGFAKATGTKAYQAAYAFYGCQNLSFCFGASSGANNGNAYTFSASSYLTNCTADETAYPAAYDSQADIIPYASCSYLVNCVSKAKNGYELTRGFFGCSYLTGCHAEMTQDASTTVTEISGFNRCSRISNCHAKITDNSGKTLTNIGGFINSTMIDNCTSEGGQIYNSSYVAKCNATAYTQSYSDDYVTAAADTAAGGWNHTGILTWKNNRWENA